MEFNFEMDVTDESLGDMDMSSVKLTKMED